MGAQIVMKKIVFLAVVGMIPVAALPGPIDDLAWLSGCWMSSNQEPGSAEHWMLPAGGTMIGMNRTVSGGKTVAFEFMRIVEQEDGGLEFIASPSGQKTTGFTMTNVTNREVIFENPDHDFPQRIIYRLVSDEELLGRIEGTIDGVERAADFPMKKVDCESGQAGS